MSISRLAVADVAVRKAVAMLVAVTMVATAGCGGDQLPVVPVTGTITLEGAPLADALVEFQPFDPQGSPSYGSTDASGKYELAFSHTRKGAWVGEHLVRISTRNENERIPEKLPPRFHAESDLKRQVRADEDNVLDFAIELSAGPKSSAVESD